MLIDLVMVTEPKPPGSSTLISPPAAVFEMAPANVLHGAVRLHGLASSPTPDTHVRVACACANAGKKHTALMIEATAIIRALPITHSFWWLKDAKGCGGSRNRSATNNRDSDVGECRFVISPTNW